MTNCMQSTDSRQNWKYIYL